MEMTATLKYCCADRFKQLYGKYMRSIKKQYGKKLFHNAIIKCEEKVLKSEKVCRTKKKYYNSNCCTKCYKQFKTVFCGSKNAIITLQEMKISVRIENE
jgi:hypothetical protein